ncbi:MAG: hypothetical protein ABI317_00170 [Gaiellales bacterium]
MNANPRPAARVLLSGRYLVPRVSLLARPDGPVIGLDLTRGVPVRIELIPARGGNPRSITASDLVREGPLGVAPDPPSRRSPPRAARALRGELAGRRARITLLGGAVLACALVVASVLGGTPHAPRAEARVPPVRPPVVTRHVRRRAHVTARVRGGVALPAATSRGGPARVLLAATPPRQRVPATIVRPSRSDDHASTRSPGWVDGLFVGS